MSVARLASPFIDGERRRGREAPYSDHLPFFFISGLHPVAPHEAAAFFFCGDAFSSISLPASTAATDGAAAVGSVGDDDRAALGGASAVDPDAVVFVSGAGAADSVLLQPAITASTERTASDVKMASNESDLPIS
jgi:hypothetical protein